MKRPELVGALRFAGYHDDAAAFTRLFVENRISHLQARLAFTSGKQARAAGVRCECSECGS